MTEYSVIFTLLDLTEFVNSHERQRKGKIELRREGVCERPAIDYEVNFISALEHLKRCPLIYTCQGYKIEILSLL